MKNIKKSYFIIFGLIVLAVVCFSTSYAIFSNTKEEHGKLNIVAGNLNYKIESSELDSDSITIPVNTSKEIRIKLTSLNEVSSKYELYYILDKTNDKVSVGYSKDTKDSVLGTVEGSSSKMISIVVRNDSDTSSKVTFKVLGGLLNNNLALKDGNSLNQEVEPYRVLSKAILEDNKLITATPTLTTSSNNTNDASGLYSSTATNTGEPTYYFRGNVTNNYVKFAGQTWRIVRVNEDGTIKLIMNNAINNNKSYNFQINSYDYKYMYYTNGKAKSILSDWYDSNLLNFKSDISTGNYYCEQAKVKANSSYTMGNENTIVYSNYIPNFKCSTDKNGYGLIEDKIGLISYDELVMAGLYYRKSSLDNYLSSDSTWTSSPSGIGDLNGSSYPTIWIMTSTTSGIEKNSLTPGSIYYTYSSLRPVINLKSNTQISSGNGTKENPFVVE